MKKIFLPLAVAALAAWAAPEAAAQLSVGGGYANLMLNQVLQDNQTKEAVAQPAVARVPWLGMCREAARSLPFPRFPPLI